MHGNRTAAALLLTALVVACDDGGTIVPVADEIGLELIAEGLTAPVTMAEAPDGSGRLFIADQAGLIRVIGADGQLRAEPFLDLRDRMVPLRASFDERGLLGLAFHPNFQSNGRFFIYYSAPLRAGAPAGFDHTSHISEFRVAGAGSNAVDAGSERVILQVDQPQANHNAGTVLFGPDGNLYISLGDGGGADDVGVGHVDDWYAANEGGNGQDVARNLLGSILRIDVDSGDPYGIPADNPFVGEPGMDEIWAFGFRNPYRFSFDQGGDNALLVGDAGQNLWEEVSVVTRGGNYGWNVKEGTHCFSTENPDVSPGSCPSVDPDGNPLIDPVIEFRNSKNNSGGVALVIVAGHVYRGTDVPSLAGRYIFGGWSTSFAPGDGRVLVAQPRSGTGLWDFEELLFENAAGGRLNHFVLGVGQDLEGEVYLLTSDAPAPSGSSGRVYRIANVRG